jgi:hypothetical protein
VKKLCTPELCLGKTNTIAKLREVIVPRRPWKGLKELIQAQIRLSIPYSKCLEQEMFQILDCYIYLYIHNEIILGTGLKAKQKIHLCLIWTSYT